MFEQYFKSGHGLYQHFNDTRDDNPKNKLKSFEIYHLMPQNIKYDQYDYYGSHSLMKQNEAEKKRVKIEDYLIMNVRIIKIGEEEAITLSNEIIENT